MPRSFLSDVVRPNDKDGPGQRVIDALNGLVAAGMAEGMSQDHATLCASFWLQDILYRSMFVKGGMATTAVGFIFLLPPKQVAVEEPQSEAEFDPDGLYHDTEAEQQMTVTDLVDGESGGWLEPFLTDGEPQTAAENDHDHDHHRWYDDGGALHPDDHPEAE